MLFYLKDSSFIAKGFSTESISEKRKGKMSANKLDQISSSLLSKYGKCIPPQINKSRWSVDRRNFAVISQQQLHQQRVRTVNGGENASAPRTRFAPRTRRSITLRGGPPLPGVSSATEGERVRVPKRAAAQPLPFDVVCVSVLLLRSDAFAVRFASSDARFAHISRPAVGFEFRCAVRAEPTGGRRRVGTVSGCAIPIPV